MVWFVCLVLLFKYVECRTACDGTKVPLEIGEWNYRLVHMDSAVVENKPVSFNEGQIFVYENDFPGYIIRYINVDNLAMNTCGAKASIKKGGVGTNSVLIVLEAQSHQGIRSVVDIWGAVDRTVHTLTTSSLDTSFEPYVKSKYLPGKFRAVSHNRGFSPIK